MRARVAATLLAAALIQTGWALPPTPGPQIELYLSGSTAQDEVLENLLRLTQGIAGAPNLCEPQTHLLVNPVGSVSLSLGRLNNCAEPVLAGPAQP
jgi:hypothetical protein